MTAPALIGTLQTSFQGSGGAGHRSPGDATGDVSDGLNGHAPGTALPAAPTVDSSALGALVARFTNIDLSGVDRAVSGASISSTIQVPDAAGLLGRAAALQRIAGTLQPGGATSVLDQLRAGPAADAGTGMASVEASLGQLVDLQRSDGARALLDVLRGVLPATADLEAPVSRVGDVLATARDLITMIGGMMAIDTAATDVRDAAAAIDGLLAPETVAALVSRVQVWANASAVVTAVSSVTDPEDAAQVAAAARSVQQVTDAIDDLVRALTRGMGFGEATLVHADPVALVQRIDAACVQLRAVGPDRVRVQAEALGAALERVLPATAPTPLAPAWDSATALADRLASAITGLSADPIVRPVQQALGTVTSALHQINQVFGEVSGAIRGAFATVRGAVSAIDVQAIARAVTAFLQPLVDVLHELDTFLGTVMTALGDCVDQVKAAIAAVKTVILTGAGFIKQGFEAVRDAVKALDLEQLIDDLRGAIQGIADALHQVQLQPYFDKAIEVMNTAANVLSAVPLSLLPDSAKQELDKVTDPIKAIDFQADVADVLEGELHTILARLDTDALDALDDAFQQVVAFLETLDPNKIIDPLDQQFDGFMARVRASDPEQILQPAFDAIDQIRGEIGRFDLRDRILGPVERVFDQIAALVDRVDPAPLLQPLEDQVASVRQRILDVTHLDQWAGKIDDVHRAIDSALARIDPAGLGPKLDAVLDAALATAPAAGDGAIIGSLIASLVDGLGLRARPASFTAVLGWMTGDDGAAEIRALVTAADGSLAHALATVRAADLRTIGAALDVGFRRLRTAVEAHPAGSALRLRIDPMLAASAPLDALGALGASQDTYVAALAAAAAAVHAFASRGQSEITVAATGVRRAFAPLAAVRGRCVAIFRGLGVDLAGKDLRGVLAPLLAVLRPSRLLGLFAPVVSALRDKIRSILVDGLITPVQDGVHEVQTLIAQLDISIFRTELTALFAQLHTDVEASRPSMVLAPTLGALTDFQTHLASYDPLAPIRDASAQLRAAVDDLATNLRPSVLLGPVVDVYQEIVGVARALNVRDLLQPVLDALGDIEHQLDGGLDGAATALTHLKAALPGAS